MPEQGSGGPVRMIDTPGGPASAQVFAPAKGKPKRTLVLGHGAGGGTGARDLQALASVLPAATGLGISVVLVEQPWRLAGRKVAGPPPTLDLAWVAVLAELRKAHAVGPTVIVGGRSAGARVACRTATTVGAAAVLALSFPLHPPGRPERSRVDELLGAGVPTLVVQGEKDSFGGPPEFPPGTAIVGVPGADHGFKVPARAAVGQAAALTLITEAVLAWIAEL